MDGIDPDTLLEWLQAGTGDDREIQLMALEQLCMLLLMSDNIDRCFETCPPRTFLPALCKIFIDETAPENVLEVTARAITYYLDISTECARRITQVEGAIKAICQRLNLAQMDERTGKDLAEQCVKLLEHVCHRETTAVYDAGGLQSMLSLIRLHGNSVHKDTLHSAMSVVTRLCSKMEPLDSSMPQCSVDLGFLLEHEDGKVSECALRCFAALIDRFIRKSLDPAELVIHSNLIDRLLTALNSSTEENNGESFLSRPSSFVSIVLSLLSNLCRGSAEVTERLMASSQLVPALKTICTSKDERLVMDCLRLFDLVLVLLCEGRTALPKSAVVGGSADNVFDRTHRYLIDAVRRRDTDALIDAVESGSVSPNFTDDVGQTLLNWCSAFGTIEMVSYLCNKGADVNKGQRSSSLHYAACFGRPEVVKILLRNGANPDLRDEEGKTPLDKARERSEENHQQVARILESPGAFLSQPSTSKEEEKKEPVPEKKPEIQNLSPETVAHMLEQLLPVFCSIFQKSLDPRVRRSVLSLLRKAVCNISGESLKNVLNNESQGVEHFSKGLVSLLGAVLEHEDDLDGLEQSLTLIRSLLEKDATYWIEQMIRFGLIEKVESIATREVDSELSTPKEEKKLPPKPSLPPIPTTSSTPPIAIPMIVKPGTTEATEIVAGQLYRWKDWCLIRSKDSLLVWCDVVAMEYSDGSNGWFRYLMDGKLHTMYSSGSLQSGAEKSDTYTEFKDKFHKSKMDLEADFTVFPIFNVPSVEKKIESGNWMVQSAEHNELSITNKDGQQQRIVLKNDIPGFVFESSRSVRQSIIAEITLGPEFATGWSLKGGNKRAKFRSEGQRNRVQDLATEIWDSYLNEAKMKPREALVQLKDACKIVSKFYSADNGGHSKGLLCEFGEALHRFVNLISSDQLSIYELSISGFIPVLLNMLEKFQDGLFAGAQKIVETVLVDDNILSEIVRKIVMVLESSEKFPQFLYDSPGGSPSGLQLLTRRVKFTLEYAAMDKTIKMKDDVHLFDRSKRALKAEPLTTVGQMRNYIYRMVARQWYDKARSTFDFVQKLKEIKANNEVLSFSYQSDFDEEGILYWIGTNGRTTEWVNPASVGVVNVMCSDGPRQPYGRPQDIVSRDVNAINCHTSDDKNAFFTIDLGVLIYPNYYTLRHARGYGQSALRNWILQGSGDGVKWHQIMKHNDDAALGEPGSTASWPISVDRELGPFRFIRIKQNGKNASGQTSYISLSGFEIYGDVVDVVVTGFGTPDKSSGSKVDKWKAKLEMEHSKALAIGSSDATPSGVGSSGRRPSNDTMLTGTSKKLPRYLRHNRLNKDPSQSSKPSTSGMSFLRPSEPSSSSSMGQQKSMSTNNLHDDKPGAASVASTNQAASAESLQHQTPSLENLLVRSRLLDANIPEVSASDENVHSQAHSSASTVAGPSDPADGVHSADNLQVWPSASRDDLVSGNLVALLSGDANGECEELLNMYREHIRSDPSMEVDLDEFVRSSLIGSEEEEHPLDETVDFDESIDVDALIVDEAELDGAVGEGEPSTPSASAVGNSDRGTLGFYSQALRDMLNGEDMYEDEMTDDTNEEDCDDDIAFFTDGNRTLRSETLAAAVAAIRRRLTGGSSTSSNSNANTNSDSNANADQGSSNNAGERMSWRQIVMGEVDRILSETGARAGGVIRILGNREWDDEYIVRRHYGALIPAFDPRPGRTNVNQTEDVELPPISANMNAYAKCLSLSDANSCTKQSPIHLYLKGPDANGDECVIELSDDNLALFVYLQEIYLSVLTSQKDKLRRIWDPTYTLIYSSAPLKDVRNLISLSDREAPIKSKNPLVDGALKALSNVEKLFETYRDISLSSSAFISEKLTQKLIQELSDPLLVSSNALPRWCGYLVNSYPFLFSAETRNMHLKATAFGTSRAIVWLQSRRDEMLALNRGGNTSGSGIAGPRRDDHYAEFRIGRIKHERIKVPRSDEMLMDTAVRVLKFHAARKSVLEIQYQGEEGTGLGPTLEFYALVAAEFQRKSLAMWFCDDYESSETGLDLGEGMKPPGYYVRRPGGLFPAPIPVNTKESDTACEYFHLLGIFLAKVLQDGRLVDLPISIPFLKLLVNSAVTDSSNPDLSGLLTVDDLEVIHPPKARFLKQLAEFVAKAKTLSAEEVEHLTMAFHEDSQCRIDDLCLTFAVDPPSKQFTYGSVDLIPNGSEVLVTNHNVGDYLDACLKFYLDDGIRAQVLAFREGFDLVFPLSSLRSFAPAELQTLLFGEQCPEWTREDLLKYTEPKLGYAKDSPGFLRFVDVLVDMNASERKAFLQFTTGCSSLPPGGLANLHPRLTVVRKVDSDDGTYPSVNTCVHYLKLPEYSSKEILRERLLAATNEKGFHLN
ncbi:hypothetical protein QR680_004174 [Steinernema hermaphroditum]|uniref:E3 ubiquitin-protein ligase n=1 Tax=Steinernema hermaphroditum TaxID=289476 RepID=A0AA39LT83_9BILA|nr:hypothetical protein QR680_004174 [Steinernema hermaphroditum]